MESLREVGDERPSLAGVGMELLDADQIRSTGVDPNRRAEELDVDAFIRLAELWLQRGSPRGHEKGLSDELE